MDDQKSTKNKVPLPPGPRGLPIVGYLPFLNSNLHVCFANLAKTYGPIIKLQLGSKACIVLSSATVAKEVLKDNDIVFANRDVPAVAASPGAYGGVDIIWSPYGEHWRMLRKICVGGLLSTARLEFLYDLRRREVRDMVNQIYTNAGQPVDIGENSLLTFFHVITSMLWGGTDEKGRRKRVSLEFREITEKYLILFGELNVSDLFPALAMFDLQGKERKLKRLHVWFDRMFDVVIDKKLKMEREGNWNTDIGKKDFLQVLLEFKDQEEHKTPFTITHIKSLFMYHGLRAKPLMMLIAPRESEFIPSFAILKNWACLRPTSIAKSSWKMTEGLDKLPAHPKRTFILTIETPKKKKLQNMYKNSETQRPRVKMSSYLHTSAKNKNATSFLMNFGREG
ncbi:hypothetical protein IFM89_034288 [Coptis chinensis]|uniref:Cytochrome P450 n=1 Tax=Coptis chinensis TaxID=261450 RepID=A0A835M5H1_9MAGN|nr:hypothetical protein IFM89_034288 [Coptis chinensis]